MKNPTVSQAKSLKKKIGYVSNKLKDNTRNLVDVNSKQFNSAIEANSKTFNSINKILAEREIDPCIVGVVRSVFIKNIQLSESTMDSIIDSYNKRMELFVDFSNKFTDALKELDLNSREGIEVLMALIQDNLDKSTELSLQNMEQIAELYYSNLNIVLTYNRKFSAELNSQSEAKFFGNKKKIDSVILLERVSEWWNDIDKARA